MSLILLGLVTGAAFGAVLMLSGLSNPRLIIDMLRFRDLFLLKVLVTALVTGITGVALLDAFGAAHTGIKPLQLLAVSAGGSIFGLGFAISGYCPGTSLAAAAEGRRDALFTVLGGLAGTGLFALVYDSIKPVLIEPLAFGRPTLHSSLGLPALALALPIGAAGAWLIRRWLAAEHRPPLGRCPPSAAVEPRTTISTAGGGREAL
jgi:uncharacterized membrane protein YedE/YeeE